MDDIDDMRDYISLLVRESLRILGEVVILVFSSNGEDKISYHIVIDCIVPSKEKAKQFTINILTRVNHDYNKYVDLSVYKKNQSFRTYGSYKLGTDRYKKFVPSLSTERISDQYKIFKLSLLSHRGRNTIDYDLELSITKNPLLGKIDEGIDAFINNAICESEGVEELAYTYSVAPSQSIGKAVHYKRIRPSYCSYCDRTHDGDNIEILLRANGKCFVKCFRNGGYVFLTFVGAVLPKKDLKTIPKVIANPSMRNEKLEIIASLKPVKIVKPGKELFDILTSA